MPPAFVVVGMPLPHDDDQLRKHLTAPNRLGEQVLYLGRIWERNHAGVTPGSLPTIAAPAVPPPAPSVEPGAAAPGVTLPSAAPAGTTAADAAPAPAPDAAKAAPEAEKKN